MKDTAGPVGEDSISERMQRAMELYQTIMTWILNGQQDNLKQFQVDVAIEYLTTTEECLEKILSSKHRIKTTERAVHEYRLEVARYTSKDHTAASIQLQNEIRTLQMHLGDVERVLPFVKRLLRFLNVWAKKRSEEALFDASLFDDRKDIKRKSREINNIKKSIRPFA